jgi:carboxylesterase
MPETIELRGSDPHRGESFYLAAGPIGCVLLHGFLATPHEMRWLGQHLHRRNITIDAPRLAGHGARPEDLARATWRDWYDSALQATHQLRQHCTYVFAAGQSLGGALSLLLAAHNKIDGAIAINTALRVFNRRLKVAHLLAPFIPYSKKGLANLHDPEALAQHADYRRIPTRAAASLYQLTRELDRQLPNVAVPLLIVQSRQDQVVRPDNAQIIFERVASTDKHILWLERGGHIASEDYDKQILFDQTLRFLQDHGQQTQTPNSNSNSNSSL